MSVNHFDWIWLIFNNWLNRTHSWIFDWIWLILEYLTEYDSFLNIWLNMTHSWIFDWIWLILEYLTEYDSFLNIWLNMTHSCTLDWIWLILVHLTQYDSLFLLSLTWRVIWSKLFLHIELLIVKYHIWLNDYFQPSLVEIYFKKIRVHSWIFLKTFTLIGALK